MNAITKQDDPINKLRTQVAALGPELRNALPSHIKPEKFQRVMMTVVQQSPELLAADRRSLFASCMKCAADGLVPDGREAALVIFNTNIGTKAAPKWAKAVQYMPMMAGILKRIRNSHEIASVQAHVIYQNDQFLIRRGLTDTLEHTPLFPGDRGKPIGAYAVAKFKDGSEPQFEVMDLDQINKVRSVSKSKDGPTWTLHWDEMARKTVFRRLSKWLPMDSETESVVRRDDELGTIEHAGPAIDAIVGDEQQQVSASKLDAIGYDGETIDGETGEVTTAPPDQAHDDATAILAALAKCRTPKDIADMQGAKALGPAIDALTAFPEIHKQVMDQIEARRVELVTGPSKTGALV